jgi:hypothetical protein
MSRLTELILNKAKLTYIKPGAFDQLVSLRVIQLKDNGLRDLSDGVFSGLRSLRKVQLEYNALETINACAFDNAMTVDEIWLTGNAIRCDCAVAWTSRAVRVNVHGKCVSPVITAGQEIALGDKFHVCRFTGIEHCHGNVAGGRRYHGNDNNWTTNTSFSSRYNDVRYRMLRYRSASL